MHNEQQIDWKSIDRIWDMLMSKDNEMVQLALTIASDALGISPSIFRDDGWTKLRSISESTRADFTRYLYRVGIQNAEEQQKIQDFAKEAKLRALKLQLYDKASFWRDIERTLFFFKQ